MSRIHAERRPQETSPRQTARHTGSPHVAQPRRRRERAKRAAPGGVTSTRTPKHQPARRLSRPLLVLDLFRNSVLEFISLAASIVHERVERVDRLVRAPHLRTGPDDDAVSNSTPVNRRGQWHGGSNAASRASATPAAPACATARVARATNPHNAGPQELVTSYHRYQT